MAPGQVHLRLSGVAVELETAGRLGIMTCGRDKEWVLEGCVIGTRGRRENAE